MEATVGLMVMLMFEVEGVIQRGIGRYQNLFSGKNSINFFKNSIKHIWTWTKPKNPLCKNITPIIKIRLESFFESITTRSGVGWTIAPYGLRNLITWVDQEYKLPIYITENGYGASESERLDDTGRQNYYRAYINEVLKAIKYDKADVRAYTAWSLMDNYEWTQGYA